MLRRLKWGSIEYLNKLIDEYFTNTQHPSISGLCLHLGISRSTWKHYITEAWRRSSPEELEELKNTRAENGAFEQMIEVSPNTYLLCEDGKTQSIDDDNVKSAVSDAFQKASQRIEESVTNQIFTARNPAGAIFYAKAALGYRENEDTDRSENQQKLTGNINIVILPPPEKPKQIETYEVKPPQKLPPADADNSKKGGS